MYVYFPGDGIGCSCDGRKMSNKLDFAPGAGLVYRSNRAISASDPNANPKPFGVVSSVGFRRSNSRVIYIQHGEKLSQTLWTLLSL